MPRGLAKRPTSRRRPSPGGLAKGRWMARSRRTSLPWKPRKSEVLSLVIDNAAHLQATLSRAVCGALGVSGLRERAADRAGRTAGVGTLDRRMTVPPFAAK